MSERDIYPHPTMSGRGINVGHVGRGYTGRGHRRGRSRGHKYYGANSASKKCLCTDLGNNVFSYCHKSAAY